jgi:hypothetical protein
MATGTRADFSTFSTVMTTKCRPRCGSADAHHPLSGCSQVPAAFSSANAGWGRTLLRQIGIQECRSFCRY